MAEEIRLKKFSSKMVHPNSIFTIIGKNTNYKLLFKEYGKYFESAKQFVTVMDALNDSQSLMINQTSPYNRMEDIMFIYEH